MTTPDDRRVFIKLNHNFQPPGITIDHKPFDGAVEYITLADHTRLVKEAVEAEQAAILAEIAIMRGVETAGFVSARDEGDDASATAYANALLALNDVAAAISARGEPL